MNNMGDIEAFLNPTPLPLNPPPRDQPTQWFPEIRDAKSAKVLHRRLRHIDLDVDEIIRIFFEILNFRGPKMLHGYMTLMSISTANTA